MLIVERLVQEEDLLGGQPQGIEAFAQLLEGGAIEVSFEESLEVPGTEIDLDRVGGVEGIGEVGDGAHIATGGTAVGLRGFDERVAFSQGEEFLAIGADMLSCDLVPETPGSLATATGWRRCPFLAHDLPQGLHADLLPGRDACAFGHNLPFRR
jgi:hypothetical protein